MSGAQTLAARIAAYRVCKERGHTRSGITLASNPPWDVCKFCGTHYRFETKLVEQAVPLIENMPDEGRYDRGCV